MPLRPSRVALLLLLAVAARAAAAHNAYWTSSVSFASHSRELAVTASADGVPELEAGEHAAPDPAVLPPSRKEAPASPTPPAPPLLRPSGEPLDDDDGDPLLSPDPDAFDAPEPTEEAPGPDKANSQALLGPDSDPSVVSVTPEPEPEAAESPAPSGPAAPSASPSSSASPSVAFATIALPPRRPTPEIVPTTASVASITPEAEPDAGESPAPPGLLRPSTRPSSSASPSVTVATIAVPPGPPIPSIVTTPSSRPLTPGESVTPVITVEPGSAATPGVPSPSPSASRSAEPPASPSPDVLPGSSESPSSSATASPPAPSNDEMDSPAESPEAERSHEPSPSPNKSAIGTPSVLVEPASPSPAGDARPSKSPVSANPSPSVSGPVLIVTPSASPSTELTSGNVDVLAVSPEPVDATATPSQLVPSATASSSASPTSVAIAANPRPSPETEPSLSPVPTLAGSSAPSGAPTVARSPSPDSTSTALLPRPGDGSTCLFFGVGNPAGFSIPSSSSLTGQYSQYGAKQSRFPSLSPQYLSHTHGKSWSYAVPVEANSSYEFTLGFAEVFDAACAGGNGFREFTASVADQSQTVDVFAEVGCGRPLKKTYAVTTADISSVVARFEGISQEAMLSALCYRKADTPASQSSPSLQPSPSSSTASSQSKEIVVPDSDHECISFGPREVPGYARYNETSVLGETVVYRGSGVVPNPSLPLPYRYHLHGSSWTYRLKFDNNSPRRLVLGFAEVYPKACASGKSASYRVFTVSVKTEVRILDVMKSSGCGVAEQIVFDNISPKNGVIDVVLARISGNAMLSVLCVKNQVSANTAEDKNQPALSPEPTETPSPLMSDTTSTPVAAEQTIPSPTQTPKVISTAIPPQPSVSIVSATPSPGRFGAVGCFKFGTDFVEGFSNVDVPILGSGVDFYRNSFAVVKGTPYDSVYASHLFGPIFTFSVRTGSTSPRGILLGFAEVFQPACIEGFRIFEVQVGTFSRTVDVYKEVGCNTAFDLRIEGVMPSEDGIVTITFKAQVNNAMLSTVCVVDDAPAGESNADGPDGTSDDEDGPTVGHASPGGNTLDATAVEVSAGKPGATASPSSTGPVSGQPSETPKPSRLPKENGIIISEPTDEPSPEPSGDILVNLNITSQDVGGVSPTPTSQQPTPSVILVPINSTQVNEGTTEGPNESLTPVVSPSPSSPGGNAIQGDQTPGPSPHALHGTPGTSIGPIIVEGSPSESPSLSPLDNKDELPQESTEDALDTATPIPSPTPPGVPNEGSSGPAPSATPTAIGPGASGVQAETTAIPAFSSTAPAVPSASQVIETISSTPSAEPASSTATPEVDNPVILGSESGTPEPMETEPPVVGSSTSAEPSPRIPTLAITAVPPAPENTIEQSEDPSETSQGEIVIGTEEPSPLASVTASSAPSPIGDRQPGGLIPPFGSPSSSVTATPVLTPSSITTVTPSATALPASPAPSSSPQEEVEALPSPTQDDDSGSPSGVTIGSTPSPEAGENNSSGAPGPTRTPTPSPSRVSSTSGSGSVIVPAGTQEPPNPESQESPVPATPTTPSGVPNNETDAITVTDGSGAVDDDSTAADGGSSIIAGEYKDLIRTRKQGNGFAIGMGILGALLILLLLVCLFFAIFRSRGDTYSYSSQYSAHKPTDYDEPSQGGYTDPLGPATGEYGNDYDYSGAQDGYGGDTFESRAQTQNESFTFEGAGELGGTIGSGYSQGGAADERNANSAYRNTEPDTFAEYSSLNMQRQSGGSQSRGGDTGDFSFNDTFTMPTTGAYQSATGEVRYDEYRDPRPSSAANLRSSADGASNSFNADHSTARPTVGPSESSGKQERGFPFVFVQGRGSQQGSRRHDTGLSQQTLSMSSNPSVGKSPYESGIHTQAPEDHSGNVTEGNPSLLRPHLTKTSATAEFRGSLRSAERRDTELRNDFLRDNVGLSGTAPTRFKDVNANRVQGMTADQSELSDDGPWPWWWSDKKKVPPVSPVTNGDGDQPSQLAPAPKRNEDVEETKENDSLSSNGGEFVRSIFREEGNTLRPVRTPPRVTFPTKPSHIRPDNGWRLATPPESVDEGHYENNPEFDALRRRRQPYVKSVAKRLSYGARAYSSTSSSGDTPLAFPPEQVERRKSGAPSGV